MTTLDYKAYPLGPGQIRLISLAPPPTDGSRRKWKLEVCGLDNERGRQTKEDAQDGNFHHGSINKNQVPSLSKGPGRVSGLPRTLFLAKFWVDAVCVNQKDADERSHQLSTMMAKIYESATSVIAWLGDSDSHTERAFAHLEALA
ncbi:hypothetical protein MY1884_009184 [Beauveria asiatica]